VEVPVNENLFTSLIQNAIDEISCRHPEFFSLYPLETPPLEQFAAEYLHHALFAGCSLGEILGALHSGLEYLARKGITVRAGTSEDPIATLLMQSILDAHAAATGRIHLVPLKTGQLYVAEVLCGHYALKRTSNGVCYALSQHAGRPAILISATGVPFGIWLRLLADLAVPIRCITVQSRGTPLLEGGSPHPSDLWQDVGDLQSVLEVEDFGTFDVIAWCNGSRVGIELARRMPERVASLMLVAPTFHGAIDGAEFPSPFEDSIPLVYEMLVQDPSRGSTLLNHLTHVMPSEELAGLKDDSQKRANTTLSLPPQVLARDLGMPFATVKSLRHCVERCARDEQYDVRGALAEVRCPLMLLTGTHDTVINTDAARVVLAQSGCKALSVKVLGAGHHLQWLPYPYFRYVLECLLARVSPVETARLQIECLSGTGS
jgi:pimeloyl-ACP methyl ester carboxylesterase